MKLSDFDYALPGERIAKWPAEPRDSSRMLLLDRAAENWEDRSFRDLPEILRGDELLVVNNTKVIPARLFGRRAGLKTEPAGKEGQARGHLTAAIEVLLTREVGENTWEALVRPGRKVRVGERIVFEEGRLEAAVIERGELGLRRLRFHCASSLGDELERLGHVPLPPYLDRPDEPADRQRYQTMFAQRPGAVAAPTAGLHFTPEVLSRLRARGMEICELTLQVGLGTFQPIHLENLERHTMHAESYEIGEETAAQIAQAKREGRPVVAVGTTVVRALEDAAQKASGDPQPGGVRATRGEASLFIYPGFRFRVVDQMLTNFHLPRSSLLVMVSAFAGQEFVLQAYRHAVERGYRFYSYGDCMLIR